MSWQEAKSTAERIYAELRAKHDPGFVGMVIDAMKREQARERRAPAKEAAKANPALAKLTLPDLNNYFGAAAKTIRGRQNDETRQD